MYVKVVASLLVVTTGLVAARLWRPEVPAVPYSNVGWLAAYGVWPYDPVPVDPVLERRLARLVIRADSLDEALRQFRQQANVNIVWTPGGLPVMSGEPIRLELRDVAVGDALRRLVGLGAHPPPITTRDGVVLLDSAHPVVRIYDVRALLGRTSRDGSDADLTTSDGAVIPSRVAGLVRAIQANVDPGGWRDGGGGEGSIDEFDGILIIRQSPDAHRATVRLLETLRAGGEPPVRATTRPSSVR